MNLADVILLRSAYASDGEWQRTLAAALGYGRTVLAVDAAGHAELHKPTKKGDR